ncbi:MAG: phospholipid carrier-dependent glycosyltransferase [Chloroflexi bacterium]|nr:phospholipid carrier-dependent glycosyltransferase [Chloroflexota bacterium]MCC6894933.1 phospholipid carrier-dependent glycosyltransferase [Anaerolineae bacterium]
MKLAPFHGDEAMHIYTSRDYTTVFIENNLQSLPVNPPYDIDSDPRLRLLNGSVMRYSVGFAMQLAGLTAGDLPPRPGWDWGLHYADNIATGHRPTETLLTVARSVAVFYFAISIIAMFGIGWQFGGRWVAYLASAFYTLNPIILLNGRRALVESALLCFGLLTIYVALQIARKREQGGKGLWGWWAALIICAALTLVSKYSGTIFVAGAFGGIFIAEIFRTFPRKQSQFPPLTLNGLIASTLKLTASGLLMLALVVALSPALWNDPVSRVQDLTQMLQEQVEIVVSILSPEAPTTLPQRVEGILTQPFMTPVAYFEQASWAEAEPIAQEITAYNTSPLGGLPVDTSTGAVLTVLAGIGLLTVVVPQLRLYPSNALVVVLIMWLLVTFANLLINPLPWQRYYLPEIPIMTLLATVGTVRLILRPRRKRPAQ